MVVHLFIVMNILFPLSQPRLLSDLTVYMSSTVGLL